MSTHDEKIKEMECLKDLGFKKRFDGALYANYDSSGFDSEKQLITVGVTVNRQYSIMLSKELIGYFDDIKNVYQLCELILNNTSTKNK